MYDGYFLDFWAQAPVGSIFKILGGGYLKQNMEKFEKKYYIIIIFKFLMEV